MKIFLLVIGLKFHVNLFVGFKRSEPALQHKDWGLRNQKHCNVPDFES